MKLKKLPQTAESLLNGASRHMEAEYLKYKHTGAELLGEDYQKPLMGFGGAGRPAPSKEHKHHHHHHDDKHHHHHHDDDELWAQMIQPRESEHERILKGGHGVPLSGE